MVPYYLLTLHVFNFLEIQKHRNPVAAITMKMGSAKGVKKENTKKTPLIANNIQLIMSVKLDKNSAIALFISK